MGRPMSRRLAAAGHRLLAYDVDPAAPRTVDSLAAVAGAPIVILMLPSSDVVEQVLLGDGLLDALSAGSLVVDMSSSEPTRTQALAPEALRRGLELVDAPVSGGVRGAEAGTLAIMAGGSGEQFERCRPLLEAMGSKVVHVGAVGSGHALKALNNLLSATSLLISSEALAAARRFGLDPQVFVEVVNGSSGRSVSTEQKLPSFVLPGTYDSGFALQLMLKDLRIALGLARATQAPFALAEAATELWARAAQALPADADHTEIARWVAEGLER
jgi:3-hydroxyisobutyrate dehydrogenase